MGLAHGIIGWADVAVPNMGAGGAFYTELFGWDESAVDGSDTMPYSMFAIDGNAIAGMGPLSPEQAGAGQPPAWSSYVIVDDADAVYSKALELGATPVMEVMDIGDAGRMFFIIDPLGAAIGFWESGTHDGAELFNRLGAMTWNDLMCRDIEAAKAFYSELLGWEMNASVIGGFEYTLVSNQGRLNGGMMDVSAMLPSEVPAHWVTWFLVEDCDASAAKVVELGGKILREPNDNGVGRSAMVQDPSGASFGIIATDQIDEQPPR